MRNKIETSRKEYKKQRHFFSNLLQKTKKRPFRKTRYFFCHRQQKFLANRPTFFLKQSKSYRNVNLLKRDKLVDDGKKIAKRFTKRFVNIVQKLGIVTKKSYIKLIKLHLDEVDMAINKYKTIYVEDIKNRMLELNNPTSSFDLFAVKRWLWSQKCSNLGQTYEIFH